METIYWIQRLGAIHTMAWVIFWITLAVFVIGLLIVGGNLDEWDGDDEDEDFLKVKRIVKRIFKITSWIVGLSLLLGIFVPSEKDLYAIYGIGGTIDYIKSNDTAKQLPDKVINALDAWIDEQINDNQKDK